MTDQIKSTKVSIIDYVKSQSVEVLTKNIQDEIKATPEFIKIVSEFPGRLKDAEGLRITSETEKDGAWNLIFSNDDLKKELEKLIKPIKGVGDQVHKCITRLEGESLKKIGAISDIIRNKLKEYQTAADKRQKEIERKAEEKARAETERIKDKKHEQANGHREKGRDAKADILESEAEETFIPPSVIQTTEQKTKTEAGTGNLKPVLVATLQNPNAFLKWIAGQINNQFLLNEIVNIIKINDSKLNKFVNKHNLKEIPGLRIVPDYEVKAYKSR